MLLQHYYVPIIFFHPGVWYRALSLRYLCNRSSGTILASSVSWQTFGPFLDVCKMRLNSVFRSLAWLAATITHPAHHYSPCSIYLHIENLYSHTACCLFKRRGVNWLHFAIQV